MVDTGRLRHTLRWNLVEYGVSDDDPRIDRVSLDELMDWADREREAFRRQEQLWWESTLSDEEAALITASLERFSLGGAPSYPYVTRPFDYAGISTYSSLSITTVRKLLDRGFQVVRDAESRHHLLLAGLERESAFKLASDKQSVRRLLRYSDELRRNRPAAVALKLAHWGELPPSLGEQYDAVAFDIAEREIAYTYRQRNTDATAIERTMAACRRMVGRSPEFLQLFRDLGRPLPTHKGYHQLAVILDKEGQIIEAIGLCERALAEGWEGDWERRIARYSKRLQRLGEPG